MSALDWQDDAACLDTDPEVFFPRKTAGRPRTGDPHDRATTAAKVICGRCAVRAACLAWALRAEAGDASHHGIYGGLTPQERDALPRHLKETA